MLPIIQSLWIGSDLSNVEKLCARSFLDHGHEFHLYTYADIGGVPQGAVVKDGNEILPAHEIYRNQGGTVAGFSDWFRYALLNKCGGFWVDMDVVCIKPFSFDADIVFGGLHGIGLGIQPGVMRFPQGHICMQSLENACKNHNDNCPWDDARDRKRKRIGCLLRRKKEGQAFGRIGGPAAFSKAVRYFGLMEYAQPFMCFYPTDTVSWRTVFDGSFSGGVGLYENTYSIHLKNERLRRQGCDKNARFDDGSLFEQLKKKHGIKNDANAPLISGRQLPNPLPKDVKRKSRHRYRVIFGAIGVIAAFIAGYLVGR